MQHVSKASLRRVLGGNAGKSETAVISNHVFGCEVCRKLARGVVVELRTEMRAHRPTSRPGGALRVLADIFGLEQETSVDAALALAERSAMRHLSIRAQKDRAGVSKVCKSWPFVALLIKELSQQSVYEAAENLGGLIGVCIQGMDPLHYSEELRNDLLAELWAELANARRKAAEWSRALKAIARAESFRQQGSGNVWLHTHFLEIRAAIQADQGSLVEALAELESCRDIYEGVEDWPGVARTLIQAANNLAGDDPSRALRFVKQAIPLIPMSDPGLLSIANLLQVECLICLEQIPEAAGLFAHCLTRTESGRMRIRREFTCARLLHASGYRKEAERLHSEVVTADLEASLYKDAFLDLLYAFGVHVREAELDKAASICYRALSEVELAAFSHEQIKFIWTLLLEKVQRKAIDLDLIKKVRLLYGSPLETSYLDTFPSSPWALAQKGTSASEACPGGIKLKSRSRFTCRARRFTGHVRRVTCPVRRVTWHAMRFTGHAMRFTWHDRPFTCHARPFTCHAIRFACRARSHACRVMDLAWHARRYACHAMRSTCHTRRYACHVICFACHVRPHACRVRDLAWHARRYACHAMRSTCHAR
ncbi:MAG: hypothetical protein WAM82_07785 [Thermoanaerobaculia bacterium]